MSRSRSSLLGVFVALLLLLGFSFFLRTYDIAHLPAGLYPDEAMNGVDGIRALETGRFLLFYPNNYGREGLFINLQAIATGLFGYTVPVLKFWSAVFGTLTVLGIYLLATELFRRREPAFIAAFFVATAYWTINFSRIGFRAIMLPFLLAFIFYFFFRGLRRGGYADFVISGALLGLSLHTYIAARLTPLVFILILPFLFLSYEHFLSRYWKQAVAFLAAALVVAMPLLYVFFVANPADFASRSAAVSVFSPEVSHGHPWQTLGRTIGLSLLKYNFWGDQNWRHNYPPYPVLDPITGTLFLAGFLFVLWRLLLLLKRRLVNGMRDPELGVIAFLLVSFFVMLMPEFLTEEGVPHALRAIGTQIPVFLLAALPAAWIVDRARRAKPSARLAFLSLLVLLFVGSATINLTKYFIFFNANPNQHGAFNEDYTNMAKYLVDLPADVHKYVYANAGGTSIDNGLPITAQSILFLTHNRVQNLEFLTPESVLARPAAIILMRYDDGIAARLKTKLPDIQQVKIDPHPGLGGGFTVFLLPEIRQ